MVLVLKYLLMTLPVSLGSFGWGACKEFEFKQNLNLNQYSGTWYEVIRDATMPFEKGSCSQTHYKILEDEAYFKIINSEIRDGKWKTQEAKGYLREDSSVEVDFFWWQPAALMQIIETNYTSFAIAHSCYSVLGLFHWDYNWLLSREQSEHYEDFQVDKIISLGTKPGDVHHTVQKGCPNLPISFD